MGFLLVVTALLLLVAGLGSILDAVGLLRSQAGAPKERRRLWRLLALGILGGGYLSVGLVYASAKTRWFGAPMPMVIFQRMGENWADFVSPLALISPFYNFILWLGLAVAPVTLPRWWRRSGRAWWAELAAAPSSRKVAWTIGIIVVLVLPPLLGYLTTSRHIVTIRNESAVPLEGVALVIERTSRGLGPLAPGEQRVLDFEQSITTPYVFSRRDGKTRVELGRCDHTNGRLNRYVVTISGEHADRLECQAQEP